MTSEKTSEIRSTSKDYTPKNTLGRALEINLNPQIYGTFAEIGAGQEVARFFFQAGKASQTIAKTISAYDMIYSDEIYGKESSGRYVCESRLLKMLDKEYGLLNKRLSTTRGAQSCFFAFANTVATGDQKKRFTHGWLGIRFQLKPQAEFNQIILHVRMLDKLRLQQQETLGVLGVNLVYTAFNAAQNPETIVDSLVQNIKEGQVSIDLIKCSGPDLKSVSNQLLNLELVRKGLAEGILFGSQNEVLTASDELFQKAVMIQRGIYHPVTKTHLDVFDKGSRQFKKEFPNEKKLLLIFEMNMKNLMQDGFVQEKDFLDRITALTSLGYTVLVSQFHLFYQLKNFIRQYTEKPLTLILSAAHLGKLFEANYYENLQGGLLEGLGKLLDEHTKVYVYPHKTELLCTTSRSFFPEKKWLPIYQYFLSEKQICDIADCDETDQYLHSDYVRDLIEKNNSQWKDLVPEKVRDAILNDNLYGLVFQKK